MISRETRGSAFSSFAVLSALGLAISGCAKLGSREAVERLLAYRTGAEGCLNEAGKRVQEYVDGTVDPKAWEDLFYCAEDSLTLFKTFIRGTDPDGLTRKDIQSLVSRFLVTDKPITDDLVGAVFDLKAGLLGGSTELMAFSELEVSLKMLAAIRKETVRLIPSMKLRAQDPTPENLIQFAKDFEFAAAELRRGYEENRAPSAKWLRWSSVSTLVRELEPLLGFSLPTQTVPLLRRAKNFLIAGNPDGMEPGDWGDAITLSGRVGGPFIALMSGRLGDWQSDGRLVPFLKSLGSQVIDVARDTLKLHGGQVPLTDFDQILDEVPDSVLTTPRGHLMDRAVLKRFIRTFSQKLFRSESLQGFDLAALNRLWDTIDTWATAQGHLDGVFLEIAGSNGDSGPLGVDVDVFTRAALEYEKSLDPAGVAQVRRVVEIARRYRPVFVGDDRQMTFGKWARYSRGHLTKFLLQRTMTELLLRAYSTVQGKQVATFENFKAALDDVLPIVGELQMIDPNIPDIAMRRYMEANLFTFLSDGEPGVSLDEGTYYVGFLSSIDASSERLVQIANQECQGSGVDPYGRQFVDVKCFRKIYFDRHRDWWDHFPETSRYYEGLTPKKRRALQIAMEQGARIGGFTDNPIGTYDMQGFMGVLHYLEAVFARFDMDGDQILDLSEVLRAFPLFKGELARFGGIDPANTGLLEAAFTYTVRFGAPPVQDLFGTTHFLMWWASKPFWTIRADRKAVYKVIGVLSQPVQ